MIIDALDKLADYSPLIPHAETILRFLDETDVELLEAGRCDIRGDEVYAMVIRDFAKAERDAQLEVHRKYLDIQILLAGKESIGWKPLADGTEPQPYDEQKDIQFLLDTPDTWIQLAPQQFALFLPADAHQPMIGGGHLHKLVVKVKVA
ncbi:MAG: YhcH/YjgK/YiaL family protein [Verrucomicrobiota bacterium]